jgi:hypothetical protein
VVSPDRSWATLGANDPSRTATASKASGENHQIDFIGHGASLLFRLNHFPTDIPQVEFE